MLDPDNQMTEGTVALWALCTASWSVLWNEIWLYNLGTVVLDARAMVLRNKDHFASLVFLKQAVPTWGFCQRNFMRHEPTQFVLVDDEVLEGFPE
jgi:hypothetical protein